MTFPANEREAIAAREQWLEIEGNGFLVRRPTGYQFALWKEDTVDVFITKCVVDWRNGNADCPPFNAGGFREWVQDNPETMNEIYKTIVDTMRRYWEDRDKATKKSETSSTDSR